MAAVLPISITESGRQRLGTFLWFLHLVCAICGLVIISTGMYMKLRIQGKVNLIEGYDGNILPILLVVTGVVTTVISIVGCKICGDVSELSNRHRVKSMLLPYLIIVVFLDFGILVVAIVAMVQGGHLTESLGQGLTKFMKSYKDTEQIQRELNLLQIDFKCCGGNGYEDWFAIQWIGPDYLKEDPSRKKRRGKYLNDDAPYSCCRPNSLRPCIHHHVHDNNRHYNYDHQTGLTLYKRGCKGALGDYFKVRINRIRRILHAVFLFLMLINLLLRYLQTSIRNAYNEGDPEGRARGWLLESIPFARYCKKKSAEDETEDDETDLLDGDDVPASSKVVNKLAQKALKDLDRI